MKYVDVGGYWCVTVLAVIYGLSFFFLRVHLFVLLISFVIVWLAAFSIVYIRWRAHLLCGLEFSSHYIYSLFNSLFFISSSFNTRAFFNSILLLDYCIQSLTSVHFSCTRFFLLLLVHYLFNTSVNLYLLTTYLIIICHHTVAPGIAASCILGGFGILQNPIVYLKLFRMIETNVHLLQGEEKRLKCRFNASLRFQSVICIA